MWSGNFRTAAASLRLAKWRSLLTILGIVIGISSVVTLVSLGEGLKQQIVGQINRLEPNVVTVRPGRLLDKDGGGLGNFNFRALFGTSTLTEADVRALQALPDVETVVPVSFLTSSVRAGDKTMDNIFVGGAGYQIEDLLEQKVEFGSFFDADSAQQRFVVVGTNVAQGLFKELNPIGKSLTIADENFIIRGVLTPSSGGLLSVAETDFDSSVFLPFEQAQRLSSGRPNIVQILFQAKPGANLDQVVKAANQAILKSHNGQADFTVLKQSELLNIASGVLNIITGFISGLAAISLLVAGIGIMAIMLASVTERTREIGIRKAVGATNRQILNQFLIEGLTLSIIGGLIGVVVSLILNFLLRVYTSLQPVVSWQLFTLAVTVSVILGILFSVAPALKAARKDPIEALRGE